jgi:D-2-hydroxyacid dehydrogenase (NADP+)
MPNKALSRRSFMATTSVVPAVAATRQAVVVPNVLLSSSKPTQDVLRIVTLYKFEPAEAQRIKAASSKAKVELAICNSNEEFQEKVKTAEVVYGDVKAETLEVAKKLQWVQSGEAGMENMDPAMRQSPVILTNYQRVFAPGISETAMGLLLCLTRGLAKYYMPQFFKQRTMQRMGTAKSPHHTELVGRTMGIVGMGGIGTALARRAHYGFDMRIVATDIKPVAKPEFVDALHDPGWFPEMVPQVDVLVAAAPLTPLTERMFDEKVFRSMKKTAHFLALSRGKLYDDMALVRALKEGWISGAGLDVFPVEPPPSDHPIFDCPNVVMSAHTSGWSPDRQVRLIDLFAENVRRYTEGLPLLNVVDKQRGY